MTISVLTLKLNGLESVLCVRGTLKRGTNESMFCWTGLWHSLAVRLIEATMWDVGSPEAIDGQT